MSTKPIFQFAWFLLSSVAFGQSPSFIEQANPGKLDWTDIKSSSNGTNLVASVSNGSVYTSATSGTSWTLETNAGIRNWSEVATSSDGSRVAMIGGGDVHRGLFQSGAFNWTARSVSGRQRYWRGLAMSSNGDRWMVLDEGAINSSSREGGEIYITLDNGVNWQTRPNAGRRNWYRAAMSADGAILLASERFGQVYRSDDSGSTWQALTLDSTGGKTISDVTCSADGTRIFVSTANNGTTDVTGKIFVSTDSGATWTQRNPAPESGDLQQWQDLAVSNNGSIIYAVSSFGYVYSSANQGLNWTVHKKTASNTDLKLHWKAITCSANGLKVAACAWNQGIFTYTAE